MKIIDYSAKPPTGRSIKITGYSGSVSYISPPRETWMKGKPLNIDTLRDFDNNGLKTAFVWQYGKETHPDVMRGYKGGVEDAKRAQEQLNILGKPNHPIYFAIDFNISLNQWNETAVHYFKGVNSVLGINRTGIYGHSRVVAWAKEDNVVATVAPGRVLGWVTKAWSNGDTGADYATLYQHTFNINGPDGVKIDVSNEYHEEWGWRPITQMAQPPAHTQGDGGMKIQGIKPNPNHRGDPLFLPQLLRAVGLKVEEWRNWRNTGHGDFNFIQGIFWHHTGTNNNIPDYIQNHPQLGLCSQMHLSRDGSVQIVGAGTAYHAGLGTVHGNYTNNANQYYIGIEAASDGQAPWPEAEMKSYRLMSAAILWYLGLDATPLTLVSHHEYAGKAQGKIDPSVGGVPFNMDIERAKVQKLIEQLKAGQIGEEEMTPQERKQINDMAKDIRDIKIQLLGATQDQRRKWKWPINKNGGFGWPQLGSSKDGRWLTLVDAVAQMKKDIETLKDSLKGDKQ